MNTIVIEAKQCPKCGGLMAAGALAGLCPSCLLAQGTDTQAAPEGPRFQPPALEELQKLFPQLEITTLLGAGGMGAVYKARQPALDRWVALKILPAQSSGGANFTERFNREARALARLSHPNIVAVHEFGQAGNLHFFIMEYVDGANLRQLEQAGRLSAREALQIIPQICDALQYAHDEGVVHRDIKPENVLVDRKGRVKIADFGLAKIIGQDPEAHRLTMEGQVMGTPHYMAPEQMERPLAVDHRADIYSLGVVIYEMLTGDLPLGKFPPPSRKVQLDIRLDDVVLRALENDPERRFQRVSDVKTQVENISTTTAPEGAPSEAKVEGEQPSRKYLYWAGFPVVEEYNDERTVSWNGTLSAGAAGMLFVALGWLLAGVFTGNWNVPGGSRISLILVMLTVAWGVRRTLNRPREEETVTARGTRILPKKHWWQWRYVPFAAIGLLIFVWGLIAARFRGEERFLPDEIKISQQARRDSAGNFVAKLPGSGTLELLAVGDPGAGPTGWWSAGGEIIPNAGYEVRAASTYSTLNRVSKDVLFRFRDLPDGASMAGFSADPVSGASSGGRVFKDGKPLNGTAQARFAWSRDVNEANIRVGLALKPWRTIATMSASGTSQTQNRDPKDPYWKVQFHHGPTDTGGGAQVAMVFAPESRMWVHRLVAVDTNGVVHDVNSAQGSPIESVFLWTYTFDRLPLKRVKEFQVQVRPVHWVEFRGVALKPATSLPASQELTFGPPVERTFDEVIDFDSGVATNYPASAQLKNVLVGLDENIRWMQENGFDAAAGAGELRPLDMDFVLLKDSDWETMTAEDLQDSVYRNYYRPRSVKAEPGSATFGFRTREHGVGMLRLVLLNEKKPEATVQFKMVQRERVH